MRKCLRFYIYALFMLFLTTRVSIFQENISAISNNFIFYCLIFLNNLLMAIASYKVIVKISKKYVAIIAFIAFIIPVILPYFIAGEFISELHITLAFSGLVLLVFALYKTLLDFNCYNYFLARKLRLEMYLSAGIIILIYSKFLLVNGLMEIVFTFTIMDILAKLEKEMTNRA